MGEQSGDLGKQKGYSKDERCAEKERELNLSI